MSDKPRIQRGKIPKKPKKKSILFAKFFQKFPKKSYENQAKKAFLRLSENEIKEISKIFPFWLEAWKFTKMELLPNTYD